MVTKIKSDLAFIQFETLEEDMKIDEGLESLPHSISISEDLLDEMREHVRA